MKNEIKEILEALKPQDEEFTKAGIKEYPLYLSRKQQDLLLDYITNLQEENEELKNTIDFIDSKYKNTIKYNEKLIEYNQDYKSRNEKAIEYCNYNDESLYTFEPDYDYEENMIDNYEPSNFREDLLNILNGGDDNE